MANLERDRSRRAYHSHSYTRRDRDQRARGSGRNDWEYHYRGARRRSRERSPSYQAGQRYSYRSPRYLRSPRSPRRPKEKFQSSYSSERSEGTSGSQSFFSPSLTSSPSPGTPNGSSTPLKNNNPTSSPVCPVTGIKLFLTNSLSSLGLREKEVSVARFQ